MNIPTLNPMPYHQNSEIDTIIIAIFAVIIAVIIVRILLYLNGYGLQDYNNTEEIQDEDKPTEQ